MSRRALFIAGSHTDVGKTYVACALLMAARARGLSVEILKPVVSGFDAADWNLSDPGRLLVAAGRPLDGDNLDAVSPWRFREPLSPPMAARREGRSLELGAVAEFCRARLQSSDADLMLIEGVGGLMSPIAERATGLDLMASLGIPSVLVGGSYLGGISHTLTALKVLQAQRLEVSALVVSEAEAPGAPDFAETVADVAALAPGVLVLASPRGAALEWPDRVLAELGRLG